ncbi:MAG: MotA/TolQ/ExbB proton channel family protein [Pseudolabrys sp.]
MDNLALSPWSLCLDAGPIVEGVITVLLASSLWCWVVVIELAVVLHRVSVALRLEQPSRTKLKRTLLSPVFAPAAAPPLTDETQSEFRSRLTRTMTALARVLLADAERGGVPSLAIVASVTPFVGLFGTVWGIMTSFTSIAHAKDTSLAVVAPGIAEALAATAYGLTAAIPASVAYNVFASAFARRGRVLSTVIERRASDAARDASVTANRSG